MNYASIASAEWYLSLIYIHRKYLIFILQSESSGSLNVIILTWSDYVEEVISHLAVSNWANLVVSY